MQSRYKNENGEVLTIKGILSMTPDELIKHNPQVVLCGHVADEEGHCTCIGGGKKMFIMLSGTAVLFGVRAPTTFCQAVRFDLNCDERKTEWIPKAIACSLKHQQYKFKAVIDFMTCLKTGEIPKFSKFPDLPRLLIAH